MMNDCDTLLMVGSSFPYSEFLPEEGQARGVQIDIDARVIGIRYPMEVKLVGDARETLRALLPLLEREGRPRAGRRRSQSSVEDWWRADGGARDGPADPINPQRVFWELSDGCPTRCILSRRLGLVGELVRARPQAARGHDGVALGTLATMGPGVPYAIAAKFAYPDRPVIALVGDGAMQMNGIAELITIAKYWDDGATRRLIVLRAQQPRPQPGDVGAARHGRRPEVRRRAQSIPDFPYARYAEMIGLHGVRVDDPTRSAQRLGRGARDATARRCSRRSSTRRSRRCRRTSRFEQAKNFAAGRRSRATRTAAR